MIEILSKWEILLPEVTKKFQKLKDKRNNYIHFKIETESDTRTKALECILLLQDIIIAQFASTGNLPWFITNIPGEIYIKKEWEQKPFVKLVYIPNSILVGAKHKVLSIIPKFKIEDNFQYENIEITDDEFSELRNKPK